ncbi:alanyl-tRNA synthetase [Pseudarcicella hirudinis]|uniref:Alanine--tRNA ligase n=2 Tax=Pseudarcicella hirudinis TaxID=1079859 RepID=A0A1I5RD33_9BACT|nr:alanyl-tRNA synthetase [Pseudarcicella hirudinis]
MMTSKEIRQQFLDFFKSKEHLIVPSAPLVAKNDPTLMFNNSGMAQFKDFFLGNGTPPSKRIADTQKCLRVSGKHNDLEDVGFDTYHHTMFEMLGNWSFGDYFKKEALSWSWELLTEVYKLPKDRIYVSVFQGDDKDGVPFDQEAWDIWKAIVGEERIILGNKKDNFWEMGETGPCGPCSEIHIDLRDEAEVALKSGKELVNNDHPQVVEIWNNVFMQFERMADGSLVPLPSRHVDTGMGFERLCMAVQGKQSNYDTDVFQHTIGFVGNKCGKVYGQDKWSDIALRVIADHIRAIAFVIADGQLPSNNKAGYVIRRILRRAVRYGYTYLGFREPFMHSIIPLLADQFAEVFPELKAQQDFVAKVILEEENSFLRTLENGLTLLDKIIAETKSQQSTVIKGDAVFELNDTFGFPVDLTALIARENGLSIDEEGYKAALQAQKERSRKDATTSAEDWVILDEDFEKVEFVGYDEFETTSQLVKFQKVQNKQGTQYKIVLDRTPFYAESGGQVGDTGTLTIGNTVIKIEDTKKENDLIVHLTSDKNFEKLVAENGSQISAKARIDLSRRNLTNNNHSSTHLMQAALKQVLGAHVNQKGSLVNNELLRFDFSHFQKVTDEEIAKVEDIVNQKIRENISLLEERNVPIAEATTRGAMALFGEKYGDFVRVITFDKNFSVELCGGTHVPSTGHIGLFKIISESSVATGVRRIEAVTSEKALALINEQLSIVNSLNDLLKSPKDLVKAVSSLIEEKNALAKKIEVFEQEKLQEVKERLLTKIVSVGTVNVIAEIVEVPSADALKQLAYELKAKIGDLYCVLVAEIAGKPQLAVMIADNLVAEKGLNAGQIIREMAKEVKGGGGGQPFFATAGGSDVSGLSKALEKGKSFVA